jgi:Phosphodiester glycosidase
MSPSISSKSLRRRLVKTAALAIFLGILSLAAFDVILNKWPGIGAQGADWLRLVIGDKAVAQIESTSFQVEDIIHRLRYQISGKPPTAPWSSTPGSTVARTDALHGKGSNQAGNSLITNLLGGVDTRVPNLLSRVKSHSGWTLPNIPPLGGMAGEGQWSPYLYDSSGQVISERAFLQPDPQRPYALVAVVAFDLQQVRLNFVPGYDEPKSAVQMARPGVIPAADMASGVLVAAFNGGFKAQHGHFGVMVHNVTLIPARDGMGTVGMYQNGQVRIGAWGTEIQPSPQLIAWRQNGPLIIHDGVVNPHTADNVPQDWGYTVAGSITTARSALGISQDGRTLFYAAGTDLTLPALARALQAAGAYQAIQLDINNYYVHFESFQFTQNGPQAVPLLDSMRGPGDQRFLKPEPRDFFYITVAGAPIAK